MKSLLRRKIRLAPAKPLFAAPGEAPAVYSLTRLFTFAEGLAGPHCQAALTRCLEGILAWARERRYLVGQIKVFVEDGGQDSLWLASTGRQPIAKASAGWASAKAEGYQISLTAIVFGPDLDALKQVTETLLARELGAELPAKS
jgi:hypothetical protein